MQRRRCRELHEPGQMSTDKDPADTSPAPEWSAEERARAEADLERIMASVRAEAMRDRLPER
jgi:hypothetical protein